MTKPHWSFWVIAIAGLVWNGLGCLNMVMQTNAATLAKMPEDIQAIVANQPAWATVGFLVAVFGGALGSLALLMRYRIALYLFLISAIAVLIGLFDVVGQVGFAGKHTVATGSSLIVALLLAAYTVYASRKNWLRT